MAEGEDLTAEQTEQLLQFQDLTGIEDIDRCRGILHSHQWNIEAAVQDTFNEQEGAPAVFSQPPRSEPRPPAMNLQPSDQRVVSIQRQEQQSLIGWGYSLFTFPFRFFYSSLFNLLYFFFRLVFPDPRRNVTDPVGDVMNFIRMFEEKFGPVHPVFYQGSYSQALNDAKRELRFLLVYLHGSDHQDTAPFSRDTLCNQQVINFLNTQLLFWACDTASPEGYRVSQALRENTYPFLALIVLRDNRMTVIARIEGPIGPEEMTERLRLMMEENESVLIAARADREERNLTHVLRQEQDAAYLESLRIDQEKERVKRQAREREEEIVRQKQEEEEKHQQFLQARERRKKELRSCIPEEPAKDDADSIRVLLKLPTGTRLERRFCKSHSLKYLFYYVFCHEECPDDFQIVTNFPRRTLPCEPTDEKPEPPTFEEVGLGPSEMLFVHDNEA